LFDVYRDAIRGLVGSISTEKEMNIKLILACWVAGKDEAHEEVEINEDELLDVLRGAAGPVFKTQVADQHHWELCCVQFE
jgi:hypothetical protein